MRPLLVTGVIRHTATVFTPAGTAMPNRTIGEIVSENPPKARVFQSYGIDYCCQGGLTLREACNTYRALFAGLVELEDDLHRHIHLENSVLFPQAIVLAKVG